MTENIILASFVDNWLLHIFSFLVRWPIPGWFSFFLLIPLAINWPVVKFLTKLSWYQAFFSFIKIKIFSDFFLLFSFLLTPMLGVQLEKIISVTSSLFLIAIFLTSQKAFLQVYKLSLLLKNKNFLFDRKVVCIFLLSNFSTLMLTLMLFKYFQSSQE